MWVLTSPHMCILLVHIAIQTNINLTTKPTLQDTVRLSSKNILMPPQKSTLLASSTSRRACCIWSLYKNSFITLLNYPVCWWCSQAELLGMTFCMFPGNFSQCLLNKVNVYQFSGSYLLTSNTLDHAPSHSKLVKTNMFIADLLGAFLHSYFTWHSWWILTLAVFYWVRHLDHYCFMMTWPGTAHSLKTTELWCSWYTDVC